MTSFSHGHKGKGCVCSVVINELLNSMNSELPGLVCFLLHLYSRASVHWFRASSVFEVPCSLPALVLITTQSAGKVNVAKWQDSGNEMLPPPGSYHECVNPFHLPPCFWLEVLNWLNIMWFTHLNLVGEVSLYVSGQWGYCNTIVFSIAAY